MTQQIAIVGGGYIGAELARSLDARADVVLVEPRSHFVHAPAMIRGVVDPTLMSQALIPYDSLLTRGRVVRARAASVDDAGITLGDGSRIVADQVVVATGSGNATPFKPKGDDIAAFRAESVRIHALLTAADNVAIVGGGAVGTELAGEIAHAMPGKRVTLISAQPRLFPDKPLAFGDALTKKLERAGVRLVLGHRAQNLQSLTEPFAGSLRLQDDSEHEFDLIFPVIGARANGELLQALPGTETSSAGRIKVDAWLRPSTSFPNVFAAGDVADAGDAMTIVATSRQLPWLKNTLLGLGKGKSIERMKPYAPWGSKAPIIVPLGPDRGNSFLGFMTVGNLITRKLKGENLFVRKYRALFGQS
ncbi:NAD(P)/FAD-dependent oxidoreductase [Granulosicoccus sp. 3-233]|uniref:NAD(P)/FAD-dependent oxidoreductase n=1 Tax=Granulosicoccus sp. 3-233 TaxID=3417969 RepID=UPI003D3457B4